MPRSADRRQFGQISKLPSGRFRARYADPEGRFSASGEPLRHSAPHTFDTRLDAESWLADERRLITAGDWTPPRTRLAAKSRRDITFGEYASVWLSNRKIKGRPLADRTLDHYQDLLDRVLLPTFGSIELRSITPESVARWYDATAVDKPTLRAHAYSLLRAIMRTAADPTKNGGLSLVPFVRNFRRRVVKHQASRQARDRRKGGRDRHQRSPSTPSHGASG